MLFISNYLLVIIAQITKINMIAFTWDIVLHKIFILRIINIIIHKFIYNKINYNINVYAYFVYV